MSGAMVSRADMVRAAREVADAARQMARDVADASRVAGADRVARRGEARAWAAVAGAFAAFADTFAREDEEPER